MSTELVSQQNETPFNRTGGLSAAGNGMNIGAVAIEQERAIAEAQGQLILAKKFPRSMAQARADFLDACKSPEFAAKAFYAVKNRGSGPSIRFAEEAARCYGNFQFGHRELSRTAGKSEVEVFAWDMEKNNHSRRQITVLHILDTSDGPRKLTNQTDIDNRVANVASKQMRGRILALLPKDLVEAGQAACKLTIAGNNSEPISSRVNKMTAAFSALGVTSKHLADYIGHSLDDVTADELVDMLGVFNAIKEGAKPSEYFNTQAAASEPAGSGINGIVAAAAAATPAAAPAATAAPAAARRTRAAAPAAPAQATAPAPAAAAPAAAPAAAQAPADDDEDPPFGDDAPASAPAAAAENPAGGGNFF